MKLSLKVDHKVQFFIETQFFIMEIENVETTEGQILFDGRICLLVQNLNHSLYSLGNRQYAEK